MHYHRNMKQINNSSVAYGNSGDIGKSTGKVILPVYSML